MRHATWCEQAGQVERLDDDGRPADAHPDDADVCASTTSDVAGITTWLTSATTGDVLVLCAERAVELDAAALTALIVELQRRLGQLTAA